MIGSPYQIYIISHINSVLLVCEISTFSDLQILINYVWHPQTLMNMFILNSEIKLGNSNTMCVIYSA